MLFQSASAGLDFLKTSCFYFTPRFFFFAICHSIQPTLFSYVPESETLTYLDLYSATFFSRLYFLDIFVSSLHLRGPVLDLRSRKLQRQHHQHLPPTKRLIKVIIKMHSHPLFPTALALLASMIAPSAAQYNPNCHYFVLGSGGSVAIERVDPLLSPGVASNHVHSITGGNGFKATMEYEDTQSSTCTTMPVKQDKSNYWMPALFFQHDGQFTRVPEAYNRRIYYKSGRGDCGFDDRTAFPPGFRMMTGSATQREYNETMMGTAGNQMQWFCHGPDIQSTGFPKGFQNCNSGGLAGSMRFPSCWNGDNFTATDPLGHMAFPTNADGLAGCPAPHNKVRFPEIFIEYYLDTSQFDDIVKDYSDPNNPPWVLADGDPTGYSFHMDFVSTLWASASSRKVCMQLLILNRSMDGKRECYKRP